MTINRAVAIGYTRVSTERQATEGMGLDVQARAIRTAAKRHGLRLVEIVSDDGVSGTVPIGDRPGLSDALDRIKTGEASALIIPGLDRLARLLHEQEAALAVVWKNEGRVYDPHGEILADDPADPTRTAIRQMLGVFAQLERGVIVARMQAGRRLKAERGGYAYGAPPYGSRSVNGSLVAHPEEQQALTRMRSLKAQGKSLREIARALDGAGYRPRRGSCWHPQVLGVILSRQSSKDEGWRQESGRAADRNSSAARRRRGEATPTTTRSRAGRLAV